MVEMCPCACDEWLTQVWEVWGFPGWVIFHMCLIMLMDNRRCRVELSCVLCVVQHISWLMNAQVLGVPRRLMAMQKVKCGVCAGWTRSSEGLTRWLWPRDQRPEKGLCAAHIGHMKGKSTWVMKTVSTKSRRDWWCHSTWWRLDTHLLGWWRWRRSSHEGRWRRQAW
jgi:hypothetical protein